MAVSEWEVIQPGVTDGHPHPMPGVVVNGATEGTGGGAYEPPTTGRIFPGPRVIEVSQS